MTVDPKRVQQLFCELAEMTPPQRKAELDRRCAGEPELRQRVEALLAANDQPDSYLDGSTGLAPQLDVTLDSAPGDRTGAATVEFLSGPEPGQVIAGRYALVERIGEGGMGEVWLARQSEPVKRQVAIKLIKAGMDSRAVLSRFEQERQALAIMDHPHIARVLDGGITPSGHPFFVMELVNGLPLTAFCDQARLTPRQRLELFVPICQAVQHAHQKGIVHRDLKPANILVTMIDGRPVPKVIDFGVAKAIGGELNQDSLATHFGAVVGTLEYMSPEQAGFSGVDVDTRADIYSLGVILYELLTGLRPIDARQLQEAGLAEMIRVIREEEPSRPSTKASTDAAFPSLAALRGVDPRKLAAMLRGELDWVIMKCLEKQRDRRYETASGLARDIQRILDNEPVEARPPSVTYRLGKFLRRHRTSAIATALVLLTLLGGILGTTTGWLQARRQQRAAIDARNAERARAESERQAKEEAQKSLKQVRRANEILASVFEKLNPDATADGEKPIQVFLADQLDEAIDELEGESVGDPLDVAFLQARLGQALLNLGRPEKGMALLQHAVDTARQRLGPDDPVTLQNVELLASAWSMSERHPESIALLEDAVRRATAAVGPNERLTLGLRNSLGGAYQRAGKFEEARDVFEPTCEQLKLVVGPRHELTLLCINNLATCYGPLGQPKLALPLFEEAYEATLETRGANHPKTLLCMTNLGAAYRRALDFERARPLLQTAYQRTREVLGPDHPDTLDTMRALTGLYRDTGEVELVLPLIEQRAKVTETKYGRSDPRTLQAYNDLAATHWSAGDFERAIPLLEDLVRREEALLGRDDPMTLRTIVNLASNYLDAGRRQEALPLLEEAFAKAPKDSAFWDAASRLATIYGDQGRHDRAIDVLRRGYQAAEAERGADHPDVWRLQSRLGLLYYNAGQLDRSIPLYEDLAAQAEKSVGRRHETTLQALWNLAVNYSAAGRLRESIDLCQELLAAKAVNADLLKDIPAASIRSELAVAYSRQGETDIALRMLQQSEEELKAERGENDLLRLATVESLASLHWTARRLKESIPLYRELREKHLALHGPKHPQTIMATWNLAINLQANRQYAEAAPLLEELLKLIAAAPETPFEPGRARLAAALADCYANTGRFARCAELLAPEVESIAGPDGDVTAESYPLQRRLAVMYYAVQRLDESVPLFEKLLAFVKSQLDPEDPEIMVLAAELGLNYADAGRSAEAIPLLEQALAKPGPAASPRARSLLASCYAEVGRHEQAIPLLRKSLAEARRQLPGDSPELAGALAMLSLSLLATQEHAEAEPLLRECLTIRRRVQPESWLTYNTMSMLGGALLGQDKLEEAAQMLREGCEGLERYAQPEEPSYRLRLREACDRMIAYCEKTGDQEQLELWRRKREQAAEDASGAGG